MVRRLEIAPEEARLERPLLTRREVISIRETLEELGVARCPLCQAALVARQGRKGPIFRCGCARLPKKRAS